MKIMKYKKNKVYNSYGCATYILRECRYRTFSKS